MEYAEIIETPNMHPLQRELVGEYVAVHPSDNPQKYIPHINAKYANHRPIMFLQNQLRAITREEFVQKNYPEFQMGAVVRFKKITIKERKRILESEGRTSHSWEHGSIADYSYYGRDLFYISKIGAHHNHSYVLRSINKDPWYDPWRAIDAVMLAAATEERTEYED